MLAALAVLLLTVPLAGGDLLSLRDPGFRRSWLLYGALAVQLVITVIATEALPVTFGRALHLVSYALAFAWVAVNRHIVGLWIAALGGGMNLAAIVANGGQMPASPGALERAGMGAATEHFVNSGAVEGGARLQVLGDIFAVPEAWPLSNVFSLGDVLLVAGGVLIVHHLAGTPWVVERSGLDLTTPRHAAGVVRRWAPLVTVVLATIVLARDVEAVALGAAALVLLLLTDPRGPEIRIGRLLSVLAVSGGSAQPRS